MKTLETVKWQVDTFMSIVRTSEVVPYNISNMCANFYLFVFLFALDIKYTIYLAVIRFTADPSRAVDHPELHLS